MSVPVKVFYVVNTLDFFLSHRLPLAIAAQEHGYEVHVVSAPSDKKEILSKYGFRYHSIPFSRRGQNILKEFKVFFKLLILFYRLRPSLVHLVTIKPVIYGSLAARLSGVPSVVAAISGLGSVFVANTYLGMLRKKMVNLLYKFTLPKKQFVMIFQNPDDRSVFLENNIVDKSQSRLIKGSGVRLEDYPFVSEPKTTSVVMACRLLKEKGVFEFVEAAHLLKDSGVAVQMKLVGDIDEGNPSSLTSEDLSSIKSLNCVDLLGYRNDIAAQFSDANIVCLPSYYGEGLPKCLIEAAACGRAVITTDHPGCRDAILPNSTGLLVPTRDAKALAEAICVLINNSELRLEMGAKARKLAESDFSIEIVIKQHLDIYMELIEK